MRIDQWVDHNREQVNPAAGLESAAGYRRELNTSDECGRSFVNGAEPGNYDFFQWCYILKFFHCWVVPVSADQPYELFRCVPKRFSMIADFVIPAGTLQNVVSSTCPDVTSVVRGAGGTVGLWDFAMHCVHLRACCLRRVL